MKKFMIFIVLSVALVNGLIAQTAADFEMESVSYKGNFRNWQSFSNFAESQVNQIRAIYIAASEKLGVTFISHLSALEVELSEIGIQQTRARSSSGDGWVVLFTNRKTSSWFYQMYIFWQDNDYSYYLVRFNTSIN